jgi:hypothetical protein
MVDPMGSNIVDGSVSSSPPVQPRPHLPAAFSCRRRDLPPLVSRHPPSFPCPARPSPSYPARSRSHLCTTPTGPTRGRGWKRRGGAGRS